MTFSSDALRRTYGEIIDMGDWFVLVKIVNDNYTRATNNNCIVSVPRLMLI